MQCSIETLPLDGHLSRFDFPFDANRAGIELVDLLDTNRRYQCNRLELGHRKTLIADAAKLLDATIAHAESLPYTPGVRTLCVLDEINSQLTTHVAYKETLDETIEHLRELQDFTRTIIEFHKARALDSDKCHDYVKDLVNGDYDGKFCKAQRA